jgi:hypothetical protein
MLSVTSATRVAADLHALCLAYDEVSAIFQKDDPINGSKDALFHLGGAVGFCLQNLDFVQKNVPRATTSADGDSHPTLDVRRTTIKNCLLKLAQNDPYCLQLWIILDHLQATHEVQIRSWATRQPTGRVP